MKKGVAGVRLCDRASCYAAWPCALHGTLVALPMLRKLGRSDAFRTAATCEIIRAWAPDSDACRSCGYLRCSCPELPKGPEFPAWRPHAILADVWYLVGTQVYILKRDPLTPEAVQHPWHLDAGPWCHSNNYGDLEDAMAAGELRARELQGPVPVHG